MAEKKNAVAEQKTAEIVQFDPTMFEADAGVGLENMGQDDLALPFLKILGGMSKELDDLEDARKGDIYNTVTGAVYKGKDGIKVIPVAYQRRFIQWAPRGEGTGAPTAIYSPGEAMPKTERSTEDNKEYVMDGSGQYIEETHQHFVIVLHEDGAAETALIAMKSTQLKKSRKWNSMMMSTKMMGANGPFTPPMYSHLYRLTTQAESNDKGKWFGWEIERIGPIEDKNVYQAAKAFAGQVRAGEVKVKHSDEEVSNAGPAPF